MRGILFGGLILIGAICARAAEDDFTRSISSADFEAAGLDRLSPAQRQHLDALVAAFKQGLVTAARKSADEAREAKQKAEEALAAQHAAEAEATEAKRDRKGFFAKAKVMIVPGTRIEYAEIKSALVDPFEGWNGQTVFRLANGQRWQVINSNERFFTPPKGNVEVEIRQAALGGFWMYFPSLDKQVRVKLLTK